MERSVAKVAVDLPLAHLDRLFDYLVPEELDDLAQPGVRVKVRFAGRLRDGFIVERAVPGERTDLSPIHKVVSPEPVLSAAVAGVVRDVADHFAGTFADVVRTAVPPRHAATEKAVAAQRPSPTIDTAAAVLPGYPEGARLLAALAAGGHPRAAWTVAPVWGLAGDWAQGLVEAAAATISSGRGALLLVPDARRLETLEAACTARFGAGSFAVLNAEVGPSARYRAFLAASRSAVRLVIGTRAAVFAPVSDLGLVALWDDGNDAYAEPHAPYWHAREVAALRVHRQKAALLLAAHSRTAEVQQWVQRGWAAAVELPPNQVRRLAAAVRPAATASARDPLAEQIRIPKEVFTVVRDGLNSGPVLVQVPRAGYLPVLVCADCRQVARCARCSQPLHDSGTGPSCRWCGPGLTAWRCECGGQRLRTPVVGVARTAEELGRAFPGVAVVQASADRRVETVADRPALVLATPGAVPDAVAGYSAAVLLDAELALARSDLRTGEESVRRWLEVVAKVRSAEAGGTVLVVGSSALREVQALTRLDPAGYAAEELSQRAEAGFPPAAKLITIEGTAQACAEVAAALALPPQAQRLGPFDVGPQDLHRLTVRAPLTQGAEVVAAVKATQADRAARKDAAVRVRVDPQVLS